MEINKYYLRKGYVSNSSFNYLIESPEKFRLYLNGELDDESTESYLSVGTLTHLKVLEKDKYKKEVVTFDYETPKSAQRKKFIVTFTELKEKGHTLEKALLEAYRTSYSTKEGDDKVLLKAKELRLSLKSYEQYLMGSKEREVITPRTALKLNNLEKALKGHKAANALLFSDNDVIDDPDVVTHNEYEILWEWEGVSCKSLLDRVVVDKKNKVIKLVDLKTTSKLNDFKSSFYKYGYDRQIAFYLKALEYDILNLIGDEDDPAEYKFEAYIAAVDTITEKADAFKIKSSTIEEAEQKLEYLIVKAKWHLDNDEWSYPMEYHKGDGYGEL